MKKFPTVSSPKRLKIQVFGCPVRVPAVVRSRHLLAACRNCQARLKRRQQRLVQGRRRRVDFVFAITECMQVSTSYIGPRDKG